MQATAIYDLNLEQCADLIQAAGSEVTFLVQGHLGIGKSALLSTLAERLPTHTPVYFDCTTKDLGDIMLPNIADVEDGGYVRFSTNEELGLHLDKPIVLMIDELGKANPAVKNALTRILYERKMGGYTLHPDSLVFATTNLGTEGVGDMLMAHQWNRITVLTVRKPTHIEWLEWGINNGVDHTLLGWVRDNPQLFQTFDEVKDPAQNPYIFHPRDPSRKAFVTPRSLEKASRIIQQTKGKVDDKAAVRKALEAAKFDSVRGAFKFNSNHFPVQDYYLRVITKDAKGRITNRTLGTVFKNHADAYVGKCKMATD